MPRVTRDIIIDAPVETVWEHVADRDRRAGWLGGDLDVALEPGRRGMYVTPDGHHPVRVDEVEPGRTLRFTWGDGPGSSVTIELSPDGDASRVRVTETVDADHLDEASDLNGAADLGEAADQGEEADLDPEASIAPPASMPRSATPQPTEAEVLVLRRPLHRASTNAWERAAA